MGILYLSDRARVKGVCTSRKYRKPRLGSARARETGGGGACLGFRSCWPVVYHFIQK